MQNWKAMRIPIKISFSSSPENIKTPSGHRRQSILVDILGFSPLSSDKKLLCVSFQWRSTWKNSALYWGSSRDLEKPHWRIPCLLSTVQEKKGDIELELVWPPFEVFSPYLAPFDFHFQILFLNFNELTQPQKPQAIYCSNCGQELLSTSKEILYAWLCRLHKVDIKL
jgi:hypothetical protein